MLPTRRLYETDPYQREFSAAVAACRLVLKNNGR